jgi:arginyl-tRNA synthetase
VLDLRRPRRAENHPHFGGAQAIYNVIDARQSDPQANVIQALRGMGYTEQADHYTHFSYEMVALTPRCAVELGYDISEEDKKNPTSKSAAARASASRPTT